MIPMLILVVLLVAWFYANREVLAERGRARFGNKGQPFQARDDQKLWPFGGTRSRAGAVRNKPVRERQGTYQNAQLKKYEELASKPVDPYAFQREAMAASMCSRCHRAPLTYLMHAELAFLELCEEHVAAEEAELLAQGYYFTVDLRGK